VADPTRLEPTPLPTASAPQFLATFAVILALVAAFFLLDLWLARVDREESRVHAANLYAEGRALLAAHRPRDAVDRFASAVALDRSNVAFGVGLAEAMLADARPREAEKTLQGALDRAETDGAANLAMARVLTSQGRTEEAKSYYHRAIYGRWRADSLTERRRVRLELIALLERQHVPQELLAELLPLQAEMPDSPELRRRLGVLFIQAGAPDRGAEILRAMVREAPNDPEAHLALGEAALAQGDFGSARVHIAAAARLRPADSTIANRLELAATAQALDPTQRGIGRRARVERSRALLASTIEVARQCASSMPAPAATIADSAARMLERGAHVRGDEPDTDVLLDLATQLWRSTPATCTRDARVEMQALRLVHVRLTA
jgi:predicted Zn-dependent protease